MNEPESLVSSRGGNPSIRVYQDRQSLGEAAAEAAAKSLRALAERNDTVAVIFATGASQIETLKALTSIPGLPWNRVIGFHMDEYIGISEKHPASFRRYLRERLADRVPFLRFHMIDSDEREPEKTCREYAALLQEHKPALCLLGIGENGHLAFNDPAEADFKDPQDVRVVSLDEVCRRQQVGEGWFASFAEVPKRAITLTIPTLLRVPELIASVPGERKAQIVRRSLQEPISASCPGTALRTHPNATLYLDRESAALISL